MRALERVCVRACGGASVRVSGRANLRVHRSRSETLSGTYTKRARGKYFTTAWIAALSHGGAQSHRRHEPCSEKSTAVARQPKNERNAKRHCALMCA